MFTYRLNDFIEINTNKEFLKRMQLGDVNLYKNNENLVTSFKKEIEVNIELKNFNLRELYETTPETGYFEKNGKTYYRNCFSICNIEGGEIYYSGFYPLPKFHLSNMFCKVELDKNDLTKPIKVYIEVTPLYLMESRGRLARNQAFEGFLNDLLLNLSILKGKIPMHSAAIDTNNKAVLFMGPPNTGKTTTSLGVAKKTNGKYVSEDISFVDINTFKVISSPFTSPKIKPDISTSINKLKNIVTLYRDNIYRGYYNFVESNNLYEFTFFKDINVKALFLYGSDKFPSLNEIEEKYLKGLRTIIDNTEEISLLGMKETDYIDYVIKNL